MVENNIIQESKSLWSSPVNLVLKQDNSIRVTIDYKQLNNATVKDAYPMPRIDKIMNGLNGATTF